MKWPTPQPIAPDFQNASFDNEDISSVPHYDGHPPIPTDLIFSDKGKPFNGVNVDNYHQNNMREKESVKLPI